MTLRKNQPKMNVKSWSFSTTGMGRVILPASQLASTHSSIASSSMQGASSTGAASEAAASAIRTRGANCAGLASAGRTESAEGPRASVYAEAEPAKRASVVVRSMSAERTPKKLLPRTRGRSIGDLRLRRLHRCISKTARTFGRHNKIAAVHS